MLDAAPPASSTLIPELSSFVAGSWHSGPATSPDVNPADPSEHVALTHLADVDLARAAVDAAGEASIRWRRTAAPARGELLERTANILDARADLIARDLSREEGKTKAESLREVALGARIFRYYAAQTLDPDGETFPSHNSDTLLLRRSEPVGVVSVITPWNFPISLPELEARACPRVRQHGGLEVRGGRSAKPVHLSRALVDAGIPDGVLNLVLGKGSVVGDELCRTPASTP